jgi:hypothetical protein
MSGGATFDKLFSSWLESEARWDTGKRIACFGSGAAGLNLFIPDGQRQLVAYLFRNKQVT